MSFNVHVLITNIITRPLWQNVPHSFSFFNKLFFIGFRIVIFLSHFSINRIYSELLLKSTINNKLLPSCPGLNNSFLLLRKYAVYVHKEKLPLLCNNNNAMLFFLSPLRTTNIKTLSNPCVLFLTEISIKMNFELLPNEIILDLFEYFSFIHLFHGFFDLNTRFKKLLCQQFRQFHLDFRLLSKTNFDQICQNYVPSVIDRILSLHLSNDDDTPQQIEFFLSRTDCQLRQFIHLQSISISCLQSQQTIDQIMVECSYLPCLTRLTFLQSAMDTKAIEIERIYNNIWSLSKLEYYYSNIYRNHWMYCPNLTVVSASLRHLIIPNATFSLSLFMHLCQCTPYLQSISTNLTDYSNKLTSSLPILSITRLKIVFEGSINNLQHLLQIVPNLYHLSLKMDHIYINGNQLEELITTFLPKLKIFEMKMMFRSSTDEDKEVQLNQIVDSFRTKFWIEEQQWFVRCHWYISDSEHEPSYITLFTLPYNLKSIEHHAGSVLVKSTCPYDDEYLTCNRVTYLCYNSHYFTSEMSSRIRFHNLNFLALAFPFNEQFFSNVPILDRLTCLWVDIDKGANFADIQSQLQLVLDRAPRLYALNFTYCVQSNFRLPPMEITSVSVRRLVLRCADDNALWYYFDEEECAQLIRSSLGMQCETLWITVQNRRNILQLVNNMPNLRVLNVTCNDDNSVSSTDDELVEWLRLQLPLAYAIMRDTSCTASVELCMR
jgi:hypothetical protein